MTLLSGFYMATKNTLVEIKHDVGYGENLLEYLNISLRGKDMIGVRVVDPSEVQKPKGLEDPCSETEVAEALHVASLWAPDNQVVKVIRRLAFERDKLREHYAKKT
ncbi:MAG: hypothetical protein ACK5S6_04560 [bacterium]|jgi:hypothetical protein